MDDKMQGQPPPYAPQPQPGYPPQQAGYPPQQGGYPPQQGGYPPQGYAPPPAGYAPPPAGYAPPPAGYAPPPAGYPPQQQHMSTNNVVVVGQPQAATNTVIVQERRGVNHALHCIITFFFWPWVIVWIILCITDGA